MIRILVLSCVSLAPVSTAYAQTVTDERAWFVLSLQEPGSPDSPWRWSVETVFRSREGVSALDTFLLRPVVTYALNAHSSVGAGYGFAPSFPVFVVCFIVVAAQQYALLILMHDGQHSLLHRYLL